MKNKILMIVILVVPLLFIGGFSLYKHIVPTKTDYIIRETGDNSEKTSNNTADQKNKIEDIPTGLYVCADRCGDNICQFADPECGEENTNLNCICPETNQDCPQDCK